MNADTIRSQHDLALAAQLMQAPEVIAINKKIAQAESQGVQGVRRKLLSTSVRLSPAMAPSLTRIAQDCMTKLGVGLPVELYAYSSPHFNAACVKPEEGRLFIMFSSSLLDSFDEEELRFVMGHELGHFIYAHHDIPVGYLLKGKTPISPDLALKLTSWSRFAEISADRAGAFCTQNLHAVARSLFKLSSGVTSSIVRFNLGDFLKQMDDMQLVDGAPGAGAPMEDWFMTHPFSPLRVKALQLFHHSQHMLPDGVDIATLELGVEGIMTLMEPSYLESKTDASLAMRHLLFAGSLLVANANGAISKQEVAVFEKFFGQYKFREDFNYEKLREELPKRADQVVKYNAIPKRMQVLHDLCVMAKAEGKAHHAEIVILREIAHRLEIPVFFVDQLLNENPELD
ncbi:M48 family metallopeptidase [Neptunomonas qingdaonensis]|uniref:Peptidase family M48 n=1 Tax=Neptunomonas qingdaonensis TaxID=1045558 RepID=A0A1I2T7T3_9GAMM|nr:M48 family metallopeptidase [Neptunomonas qingdaonensis]SFG60129.1 Peptidase family M48 [Neptunomonas qingdaonensis]